MNISLAARRWFAPGRRRPRTPRRRPLGVIASVSIAPALEGRILLASVPAALGPIMPEAARPRGPIATVRGPIRFLQVPPAAPPPEPLLNVAPPRAPSGKLIPERPPAGPRPVMAAASVLVGGVMTSELAVANVDLGSVTVFLGGQAIFQVNGLNCPEGVELADITADGTPDLIIADSRNDKVLIFSGRLDGGFDADTTGGRGIKVGHLPVGLTVGDVDGDGKPDLIVANRDSNDVSILVGRGSAAGWVLDPWATVRAGVAPFRTLLVQADQTAPTLDLLIGNSGSSDVYQYRITPGEKIGADPTRILVVGQTPVDLLVGRFRRRPELDLVTVNSGSNGLTLIGDAFSAAPTRHDFEAPDHRPISAIPLSIDGPGFSDLVIATSDGRLSLLQVGETGPRLIDLLTPAGLSNITAVAASEWTDGGFALYAASSDTDAIAMLQINIEDPTAPPTSPARTTLAAPVVVAADAEFDVEVVPIGGEPSDLVGVLWSRSNRSAPGDEPAFGGAARGSRQAGRRSPSSLDEPDPESIIVASRSSRATAAEPEPPPHWSNFVLGLDAALDSIGGELAAVAALEAPGPDDDWSSNPLPTRRLVARDNRDAEAAGWSLGDRLDRSPRDSTPGGTVPVPVPPDPASLGSLRWVPDRAEAPVASEGPELTTAAVGSAVAIRLLIKTSPPRPIAGKRTAGASAPRSQGGPAR